jgi:3'-phosphoadenosine 5'-phosphosulfate sulfotransferase (PAPS reductase)/FAD synthetase
MQIQEPINEIAVRRTSDETDIRPLRVLSLGAGVQSSTLALMAAQGEIDMPDCAIFADTKAEPKVVYEWLDWLEKELPFPVYRVSQGDLESDFLNALSDPNGRCGQPPFMVVNHGKNAAAARIWRKCTKDYKLTPIRREVRRMKIKAGANHVYQQIGISLDEVHRIKPSGVRYITNVYPLIDHRMSRHDCTQWMQSNGYPPPPLNLHVGFVRIRVIRDLGPCGTTNQKTGRVSFGLMPK